MTFMEDTKHEVERRYYMKTVNHKNVCDEFIRDMTEIEGYISRCKTVFSTEDKYLSFCYENAIIMLYKAFERFILRTMISCLNHDHSHFENKHSIKLGKHINDDVCEFLITKGGYFDFKGKGGLYKMLNATIGSSHNISKVIKNPQYGQTIERLCSIRNYAAHNSSQAKKSALEAYGLVRISSSGSFLKKKDRFSDLIRELTALANDVKGTSLT